MNVSYILYNYSEEMMSIAQWSANLLPESWTSKTYQLESEQQVPFLLGRILLYQHLVEIGYQYTDMPKMMYDKDGKSFFKEKLYFDISYTPGMIIVASSKQQEVGLKVEQKRPISWNELTSYFSKREWYAISKIGLYSESLVKYWLSREAAYKLIGNKQYRINEIDLKRKKLILDKNLAFYNTSLKLPNNYLGQLVTRKSCKRVKISNVTPNIGSMLRIIRA